MNHDQPAEGGNSPSIVSTQSGPHERLPALLARRAREPFRKPIAEHTRVAFEQVQAKIENAPTHDLVVDAGCGTGASTERLAVRWPNAWVIGVDKSAARLGRGAPKWAENVLRVRADLVDFWRLAQAANWQLAAHYLLYPNPWPKPEHLARRWHGHPVWPTLLALGGRLELRTNWRIYADEFSQALQLSGIAAQPPARCERGEALTPHEAKYQASGHACWQLVVDLGLADNGQPGIARR